MISTLTYKRKNTLLLIGSVLFMLICYSLSISKSIEAYELNQELKSVISQQKTLPSKKLTLIKELKALDSNEIRNKTNYGGNTNEQIILAFVSNYCKESKLLLKEFPKTFRTQQNEYELQTNYFNVSGSFSKILRLIYLLEQTKKIAKVSSVDFQTKTDLYTNARDLNATIYLQQIIKKNEN